MLALGLLSCQTGVVGIYWEKGVGHWFPMLNDSEAKLQHVKVYFHSQR
jgi:hypothetical protein